MSGAEDVLFNLSPDRPGEEGVMDGEREKLVDEYHASVKKYNEAVGRLIGLDGPEFEDAYRRSELAREACEARREALRQFEQKRGR